jgi:hypothetical protein
MMVEHQLKRSQTFLSISNVAQNRMIRLLVLSSIDNELSYSRRRVDGHYVVNTHAICQFFV